MKSLRRGLTLLMAVIIIIGMVPLNAFAALADVSGNEYIIAKKISNGKTGKNMTISFDFKNTSGRDLKNVEIGFSEDVDLSEDAETLTNGYRFPFEVSNDTFKAKNIGSVKDGATRSVSFNAKVRRDLPEGYYTVPIKAGADGGFAMPDEYVNIWITKSAETDETESEEKIDFIMGENQETPSGSYPEVMNFNINVRNSSRITAQDVTVSMVLSKDSAEFPFEINEANYDRHFDRIGGGETASVPYSMAIRSDVYSGFFPIKFNITYRDSAEGDLQTVEKSFYVKVKNKEKEDSLGDFDANDRIKARLIVDSFETIPAEIYAGETFELVLHMKNASANVPANNILFSLESEKVTENAVFTTESGSSSFVVNELGAGQTTDLRITLQSKAGVDQRSYSIKIHEKYDSPEFKNADESVSIDIPIKQRARLNTGTIEIMPDNITVGSETNVMFGINNTGRVILYNVMATFEADSIQNTDTYVGNIKPGETGNVDVMISGAAPTSDDGKIKITISYEDENGTQETVLKEMTLFVSEDMSLNMDDMMTGNMDGMTMEEESFFQKYKRIIIPAAALLVVAAAVAIVVFRKMKKASKEEGMEDEIS